MENPLKRMKELSRKARKSSAPATKPEKKPAAKSLVKQEAKKNVKPAGKAAIKPASKAASKNGKQNAKKKETEISAVKLIPAKVQKSKTAVKETAGRADGKTVKKNKKAMQAAATAAPAIPKPVKEARKTEKPNRKKAASRAASKAGKAVRVIPLGGLEQIGLNITAFECEDSIIVVDCGVAFPTEDMPGVDLVIPDVTYLQENISKVKGFFITHGHEDHIGALPYVLREMNVPVYATKLTMALIQHKLKEAKILESAKLRVVTQGEKIKAGSFVVEFVKTNHSIPDASALAIETPVGTLFHTGDFKIDYTPIFGEPANLQRMAAIGDKGCLALFCDSTNADLPGSTPSESTVGLALRTIFAENPDRRLIVATFASNVDRVQQIIDVAHHFGRKVVVDGRSMVQVIDIAGELGYISIPQGTLIDIDQLKDFRPQDTVIITTGSQGESMAALSRMAAGVHKKVTICAGDLVIMSSSAIPGNEKAINRVINELYRQGAEVILHDAHVSGHACEDDIKLMYSLLKPRFAFPVHGEYHHLMAQKAIAESLGIDKDHLLIMRSGDVFELTEDRCSKVDTVPSGARMVDGIGMGDIREEVLKDRQNLAQNGIIVVSASVDLMGGALLAGPSVEALGIPYESDKDALIEEVEILVKEQIEDSLLRPDCNEKRLKAEVREVVKNLFWKKYRRNPLILSMMMKVEI